MGESLRGIKNHALVKGLATQLVSFLVELHSISEEKLSRELKLQVNNPREEINKLYDKIQKNLFAFMRREAQKRNITLL